MIWDVSPIAFTLPLGFMEVQVRWYGLLFASTFLYGLLFFRAIYRWESRPEDDVYALVSWVIGGSLVGGRLGHCLFYDPVWYLTHPLEMFKVWEGGLASHGAVLGILLGVYIHSRTTENQRFIWICDRIGMSVPLSGCLIRIGNFFNSEIVGTPADVGWAVVFSRIDMTPRHPVQLYESACYLIIFLFQLRYYLRHKGATPTGLLTGNFFIAVFGARFFLEFFKENQAAFTTQVPLSVGQLLSVPAVALGAYLVVRARKPRTIPA